MFTGKHPRPRDRARAGRRRRRGPAGLAAHRRAAASQAPAPSDARCARPPAQSGVHPVFHCAQEIPCNPCTSVCPQQLIHIDPRRHPPGARPTSATRSPRPASAARSASGSAPVWRSRWSTTGGRRRADRHDPVRVRRGRRAGGRRRHRASTPSGGVLGDVEVLTRAGAPRRRRHDARQGARARPASPSASRACGCSSRPRATAGALRPNALEDDDVVCRCERVTAGELRALIRAGVPRRQRDQGARARRHGRLRRQDLRAAHRAAVPRRGRAPAEVTPGVRRPLFVEVPLGVFAGVEEA
jgi:sarcosine oxidase, subunit alpha